MPTLEWKAGPGVIERDWPPAGGRVAGGAAGGGLPPPGARGALSSPHLPEGAAMRVHVASGAGWRPAAARPGRVSTADVDFLVAVRAGDRGVFSLELERCPRRAVDERGLLPPRGRMTARAVGWRPGSRGQLAFVDVGVARDARSLDRPVAHHARGIAHVATRAGDLCMRASERERRVLRVIELHAVERFDAVALRAAPLLDPGGELSAVRVLVAGVAARGVPGRVELRQADPVLSQAPLEERADGRGPCGEGGVVPMAGRAGRHETRAGQRISGVVRGFVPRESERFDRVARVTPGGRRSQLAPVRIHVAVAAPLESEPLELGRDAVERTVAAPAGHLHVSAAERIAGPLVEAALERACSHLRPSVRGVAAHAIVAQSAGVRILVAVEAGRMRHRPEAREGLGPRRRRRLLVRIRVDHLHMALEALDADVLPLQREIGPCMAEAGSGSPAGLAVAVLAGGSELAAVLVEVTGRALDRGAQERRS